MAFLGGGVMGFAVASFGILGIRSLNLFILQIIQILLCILQALALVHSLVAFFARVGGGIFTKSADVGADLVGKLEAGIPEDDPRNPAVIADNVGDCVGDTAGMGADIYESYVGAMIGSIAWQLQKMLIQNSYIYLPLMLSVFGLVGSFIGLFAKRFLKHQPAAMLRNATHIAIAAFAVFAFALYLRTMALGWHFESATLIGQLLLAVLQVLLLVLLLNITQGNSGVKLAESSRSGAATNLIYGLSIGMESTALPVVIFAFGVWASYVFGGGGFGVSIAAVSMLATVGITMTVDAMVLLRIMLAVLLKWLDLIRQCVKLLISLMHLEIRLLQWVKDLQLVQHCLQHLVCLLHMVSRRSFRVLIFYRSKYSSVSLLVQLCHFVISSLTMRSVGDAALKWYWKCVVNLKRFLGLWKERLSLIMNVVLRLVPKRHFVK